MINTISILLLVCVNRRTAVVIPLESTIAES